MQYAKTQNFSNSQEPISDRKVRSFSGNENIIKYIKFCLQTSKPKNSFETQQTPKAINSRPMTGNNLGPGKYNIPKHTPAPSFEFPKSPRFCLDSKGSVTTIFHRVTEKQKQEIINRIEKNKELAGIPPTTRTKLAQERAYKKSIRADVTKLTQRQIYLEKKQKKQTLLKDKFRKLNYRMNLPVIFI